MRLILCLSVLSQQLKCTDVLKPSVNGESKLQQCLNLSCDKKKVARFVYFLIVIRGMTSMHALVSKAIEYVSAEGLGHSQCI